MTAPFEIEEPEPIPLSGLVHVRCVQCRAPKVACAPDQTAMALCGGCRAQVAASAATILRLPAVAPPRMVWSGSEVSTPQDRSERAEVVSPEFMCPDVMVCGHDKPGPVMDFWIEAQTAGWTARVRHSRGVRAGARTVADQWSVRFRRGPWQGYAVRAGEDWKSVCVTGQKLAPFLALGVTDLREWLADPERPAEWYAKIRKRVADQDLASKNRACPGPGVCTLDLVALAFVPFGVPVVQVDHTHRANGDIKIKKSRAEQKQGL